jgi:hypothetical protein
MSANCRMYCLQSRRELIAVAERWNKRKRPTERKSKYLTPVSAAKLFDESRTTEAVTMDCREFENNSLLCFTVYF